MRYTREDGCRAWLTYGLIRSDVLVKILRDFGNAEAVYDRFMNGDSAFLAEYLAPQQIELLRQRAVPEAMHDMMVALKRSQIGIVTMEDYGYPDMLRNIPAPPAILFYRGNLDCLMGRCVTIVGSRKASPNVLEATTKIARELSDFGVTIVSGLAMGIDGAAHRGCLMGTSPSVGVMACGLDVNYPSDHHQLKEDIVEGGGVLLSEYPPGMRNISWFFPVRNRIMAGLSSAVVMMEARIRSGSMSTVTHALDQGREVFAYPGNIGTEWAEGTHQLLKEGANYFATAADIMDILGWDKVDPKPQKQQVAELPPMSKEQRLIFTQLSQGEKSFDQLAAATGLDTSSLSVGLTMLQIQGLVKSLPGKTYIKA